MQNDTRISVDVAKAVLEVAISDRPGHNEDIHPVPVKSADQQVLTALHRLRLGWMRGVLHA